MSRVRWIVLASVCALGIWAYALFVYTPTHQATMAEHGYPTGAYNSDLYTSWLPARELFLHGRDPYSAEVTGAIQIGFYGRPLAASDPLPYTEAFVYPLYMVFLIAPLIWLPFEVVHNLFYAIALALIALSVYGWCRALAWRPPAGALPALMLLGVSTIAAVDTVLLQQPTVIVAALLAAAAACLACGAAAPRSRPRSSWYAGAGMLLALATIKPQLSGPLIAWLAIWVLGAWSARRSVAAGFAGMLALLLGGSFVLLPGWLGEWRDALLSYVDYASGKPILRVWLPEFLVPIVLGLLGLALAVAAWRMRRADPGTLAFGLGLALPCIYAVLLLVRWNAYPQLLLYPAILVVLRYRPLLTAGSRLGRVLYISVLASLAWDWVTGIGLLAAVTGAGVQGNSTGAHELALLWPSAWLGTFVAPLTLLCALSLLAGRALRSRGAGAAAAFSDPISDAGPQRPNPAPVVRPGAR